MQHAVEHHGDAVGFVEVAVDGRRQLLGVVDAEPDGLAEVGAGRVSRVKALGCEEWGLPLPGHLEVEERFFSVLGL